MLNKCRKLLEMNRKERLACAIAKYEAMGYRVVEALILDNGMIEVEVVDENATFRMACAELREHFKNNLPLFDAGCAPRGMTTWERIRRFFGRRWI
jgi:hypothetical protein